MSRRLETAFSEFLEQIDVSTETEMVIREFLFALHTDGSLVGDPEIFRSTIRRGDDATFECEARSPTVREEQEITSVRPETFFFGEAEADAGPEPSPEEPTVSDGVEYLGRYRDLGLLGAGGMGEVRRVEDPELKRTLAMKIIHPHLVARPTAVSRFIEEAQVCAQLQHPNTVPVHELGTLADGRTYFTMMEIRGEELSNLIAGVHAASAGGEWRATRGGTTFRGLIHHFRSICETLAYAHSLGVIHRDLKPGNVMIGGFGEVLVVDWGIAKIQQSDSEHAVRTSRSSRDSLSGAIAGTPAYMSPEQARGKNAEVDARSDIYALGAMLYEILSGRPPFFGDSVTEVLEKVKTTRPPALMSTGSNEAVGETPTVPPLRDEPLLGRIPVGLVEICERAMHRDPAQRFPCAEELAQAVERWLEGAQKREQAQQEVETAFDLLEDSRQLMQRSRTAWLEARERFDSFGIDDDEAWDTWSASRNLRERALRRARGHEHRLHTALVIDPHSQAAHRGLVACVLQELTEAIMRSDGGREAVLQRQLEEHLEALEAEEQAELRASCEATLSRPALRRRNSALVGRDVLRSEVAEHLGSGERLVTLTGTAGVGKTRLAVEILIEAGRAGVFCDLMEVRDRWGFVRQVARALDVPLSAGREPSEQLGEWLASHPTLLVLDNLEQVLAPAAELIREWSERAGTLQIIATSRVKLGLEGERVFQVAPLGLLGAMELFAMRAREVRPSFELSATNRGHVARIVQRVDRLPLAIDLAAARLDLFSVSELEERLEHRFSLLRGRGRGQALRGALEWSWNLLNEAQQRALAEVTVFHGGFTLAAAEEVVCIDEHGAVFELLHELCEASLLQLEQEDDGRMRYRMLESVRALASEQLQLGGAAEVIARHAKFFSAYGEREYIDGLDCLPLVERASFFDELDNLLAGARRGSSESAVGCGLAAAEVLLRLGPISLGVALTAEVLGRHALEGEIRGRVVLARARCLVVSGALEEARTLVEDDPTILVAERQDVRGRILMSQGKHEEAVTHYEAALAAYRVRGYRRGEVHCLRVLGAIDSSLGRYDAALGRAEEALRIATALGDAILAGEVHEIIGLVHSAQRRYAPALHHLEAALASSRRAGHRRGVGIILANVANIYAQKGEHTEALERYTQALEINRAIGDRIAEGTCLGLLGQTYGALGQLEQAAEVLEEANVVAIELGNRRNVVVTLGFLASLYSGVEGEGERALAYYKRAIDEADDCGYLRGKAINMGNCGNLLIALGRDEEAEAALREAVALGDEVFPVAAYSFRIGLAHLLSRLGHREKSYQVIDEGLERVEDGSSEEADLWLSKAEIACAFEDEATARSCLAKASPLVPGDADLEERLAGALVKVEGLGLQRKRTAPPARLGR